MGKERRFSFKRLANSMTITEFYAFCKKVAKAYANSETQFARTYFTNYYNVSEKCFYSILEIAIIYDLVSEKELDLMETKAISNQKAHSKEAGMSSILKYDELRRKRDEYKFGLYSNEDIKNLAEEFASSELEKVSFAAEHDMSTRLLEKLLEKACEEVIVDDIVFMEIKERSLRGSEPGKKHITEEYFKRLYDKRLLYAQSCPK